MRSRASVVLHLGFAVAGTQRNKAKGTGSCIRFVPDESLVVIQYLHGRIPAVGFVLCLDLSLIRGVDFVT